MMYNNFTMEKVELVKEYQIKYCEVDFKDELKLSSALSYLEEVACLNAEEGGFGYSFVQSKGCAFILSNIVCEFKTPVRLGEELSFKTWPLPPSYVVFGREYQIKTKTGEVKLNASSRWCLMHLKTGKIMPSKIIDNQDYKQYHTEKAIENVAWKIPAFDLSEDELKYSLTVSYSDYDHNQHVNNTKYADYCLNCFSIQELLFVWLKYFSISYVRQCKEGEVLRFYRKQQNEKGYLVQGVNEKDEIVVQAKLVFENEPQERLKEIEDIVHA